MAEIVFDGVSKVFDDGTVAVRDLNLKVNDGALMVLVGPSGCGKTTSLRMVAGLEDISAGEVRIGDRVVNDIAPKDRDIAMVFQNYALYPHMSVFENMAFGLRLRKTPKGEVKHRVEDTSKFLELYDLLLRKPGQLSGGQRQRVAMGRAIVREPKAFLMDEPLSNLDAKLRVQMRSEISRLQRDVDVTTIYVTHDQVEAMTMGDRVAVMRKGELQQVDSPQGLYDNPVNLFVGGFIGSPAMNMLEATLVRSGDGLAAKLDGQQLALDSELLARRPGIKEYADRPVIVGIRPEDLEDAALSTGAPSDRRLRGTVRLREALGSEILVHMEVDARPAMTDEVRELQKDVGLDAVGSDGSAAGKATVVGRFSPRAEVETDAPAEAVVDTRSLHFFDPETGLGI
jgi:multiple sugar transport system ATP-binding protein